MKVLCSTIILCALLFSCTNNSTDNKDFSEEYKKTTVTNVGEKVTGISITSLDGTLLNTDSLKGKTIFINFFTLACPMCMLELPELEKQIWNKYKNHDDLVILRPSLIINLQQDFQSFS